MALGVTLTTEAQRHGKHLLGAHSCAFWNYCHLKISHQVETAGKYLKGEVAETAELRAIFSNLPLRSRAVAARSATRGHLEFALGRSRVCLREVLDWAAEAWVCFV